MNNKEKTLSYLNGKAWFRFLKVVFIFSFGIVFLIGIFLIYDETIPEQKFVDNSKTYIQCNYGNKKSFLSGENNFYFTLSELKDANKSLSNYHKDELRSLCQISDTELYQEMDYIVAGITNRPPLFEIIPSYKTEGGIDSLINYLVLFSLSLISIFFAIKYVFYYVVTGKMLPKP